MNRDELSMMVISLAVFLGGCVGTAADENCPATLDVAAMREIIAEKNNEFTEAHITGDSLALIDYFTEDAKAFPPNSTPVIGHPAIAVANSEWVALGITEFREETTELYGCGDILIDEGNYFFAYGEDSITEEGKYLNVWKKVGGEWKVYSNMWSSNSPATPTP